MGKEGNSHLKSITCSILLIFPTSSPSWGGTSPIHHPRALFHRLEVTKNAIKITRSCLAGLFMGNEGNNCLESITCSVFLICPTSWGGISRNHHPRSPYQSAKVTKNATMIIRSHLASLFIRKEGNGHLKSINC